MQNIIYVFYDYGNNVLDRVCYKDIEIDSIGLIYQPDSILNFIITSFKESIFGIKPDIYCYYNNNNYLFSLSPLSLKSEKINDFDFLRSELISYLKIYFKVRLTLLNTPEERILFYFKHNLLDNIKFKEYKSRCWMIRIVKFYNKYCRNRLWTVEEHHERIEEHKHELFLFNDVLNILVSLESNQRLLFFLCGLNYLPLELLLHILPLVVPKETRHKVFFLYRLSHNMINREKTRLGYIYLLQLVIELRKTTDIELSESFLEQAQALYKKPNWKKMLEDVNKTIELENIKNYGDLVWQKPLKDKTTLSISKLCLLSGNSVLIGMPSQDLKTEFMNLRQDERLLTDTIKLEIMVYEEAYLQEVKISLERIVKGMPEVLKVIYQPVFSRITKGCNEITINIVEHLNDMVEYNTDLDNIYISVHEIIFKDHFPIIPNCKPFRFVPRRFNFAITEVFNDLDCDIFVVDNKIKGRLFAEDLQQFGDTYIIKFSKGKEKVLFHEISEGYLEKFVFD